VKAGTGRALIADHEGNAVAVRAPYFHVLDDSMELQGHQQSLACSQQQHCLGSERALANHSATELKRHPGALAGAVGDRRCPKSGAAAAIVFAIMAAITQFVVDRSFDSAWRPPTEAALEVAKSFEREFANLRRIANPHPIDFNDLLCDHLR